MTETNQFARCVGVYKNGSVTASAVKKKKKKIVVFMKNEFLVTYAFFWQRFRVETFALKKKKIFLFFHTVFEFLL